jgi:hypothetical protein
MLKLLAVILFVLVTTLNDSFFNIILPEINTKYTKYNSALITFNDFFAPLKNYLYLTAMFGFQQ